MNSISQRIQRATQSLVSSNARNDQASFGIAQEEMVRLLEQVEVLEKQASENTKSTPQPG